MDEQQDKPGFRVTDRRRFAGEAEAPAPAVDPAPSEAGRFAGVAPAEVAPVTFSTFVLGLSTQALVHLGEIASPVTNAIERDLVTGKHLIDILGILREKTRGNLEQAEEHLLDSILYDLRIRYVALVRDPKKEEA
jgi:hypothetical protein